MLVLCYHAVSERWPADLSTTPARLERQLGLLVGRGYRGATFHEAVTGPRQGKVLAVTFDDGYSSVAERAFPILTSLGLVATVFVVSGRLGGERPLSWPGIDHWARGPHERELHPLSLDQLGMLAEAGWEVGSHTRNHPRLTRLDDSSLAEELRGSREDCQERLGRPCRSLAYPYGDVDQRVVEAASEAGYEAAGALPRRLRAGGRLEWPRVGIYHRDDDRRFRLKVSPLVRRLRATPLWERLDAARRAGEPALSAGGPGP